MRWMWAFRRLKKNVAILLALTLCFSLMQGLTAVVFAAQDGDFTYELIDNNSHIKITKYSGSSEIVYLPTKIIGKPVTEIGEYAFKDSTNLKNIDLGNVLKVIQRGAFYNTGITTLSIPDSVTDIYSTHWDGEEVFGNNASLTSVTIGNGAKSIPEGAFQGSSNLTNITIGKGVASIGNVAFENCGKISSLVLPDSLREIGEYAFKGCTGLKSIDLGNGLKTIQRGAFNNTGLINLEIPDSVTDIYSTHWDGEEVFGNNASLTSVTIGNSAKSIPEGAFQGSTNLTNITIGKGVTSIGNVAFENCGKISSLVLPNSLREIGEYAFKGCTGLKSIDLGNGLKTIQRGAFNNTGLTNLNIPDSVTDIFSTHWDGEEVFGNNPSLTSVTIGNGTKSVPEGAFQGSTNLTDITIGKGVTTIGNVAFENCGKISSLVLPDGLIEIGEYAFKGCTGLKSIDLGNGLKTIQRGAFNNTGLISLNIPDSVKDIYSTHWDGEEVFGNNASLTSVTIGTGLKVIPEAAFQKDSGLTSITIGKNITSIGYAAFEGSNKLTQAYFLGNAPELGEGAFDNCSAAFTARYISGASGFDSWSYPSATFDPILTHKLVTFNINGGAEADFIHTAENGKLVSRPIDPTRTGYTFVGWYKNQDLSGDPWNFNRSQVDQTVTLYAKWVINTYNVAFDPRGGTVGTASKNVVYDQAIGQLPLPQYAGHIFMGWYPGINGTGPKYTETSKMPASDLTLYAYWEENQTFKVTFNSRGGSAISSKNALEGTAIAAPANPKRTGYTFKGWYTSAKNGTQIKFPYRVNQNITLYAQWTIAAPMVKAVDDNDKSVTGSTGALSIVYIRNGTKIIGYTKAKSDGSFLVKISAQRAGAKLSATAKDPEGAVSSVTIIIVKDKTPPAAPKVYIIKSTTRTVTGKAEAGSLVTVKRGSVVLKSAYAKSNGSFTLIIAPQKKGTVLSFAARDRALNTSAVQKVVVQ